MTEQNNIGTIRKGARAHCEGRFLNWPNAGWASSVNLQKDSDMIFNVQYVDHPRDQEAGYWLCTTEGYGSVEGFGIGPVIVFGKDSIEFTN